MRSLAQPERFGELFRRHHPLVHNYLRRRVGEALADDLAAEVFARAFRDRRRYRPVSDDARPWLLGIANNLVAGHRRAEARALRAWQRHAAQVPTGAPAGIAERELGRSLAAGLRRLSRRDREALLLLAWGELSYAEIAAALRDPDRHRPLAHPPRAPPARRKPSSLIREAWRSPCLTSSTTCARSAARTALPRSRPAGSGSRGCSSRSSSSCGRPRRRAGDAGPPLSSARRRRSPSSSRPIAALAPTGGPGARTVLERAAAAVRAGEPVIVTADIHGRQLRGATPTRSPTTEPPESGRAGFPGTARRSSARSSWPPDPRPPAAQAGSETVSRPTGGDGLLPFTTELYDAGRDQLSVEPNTKAEFAPELFRAEGLLARARAGGDVDLDRNADVDGRPAYELTWSESAGRVTIEHALWVDRESYAPLRLTERDTGTDVAGQPVDETYEATIARFQRLPDTTGNRALLRMSPHPGAERRDG